MRRTTHSTRLVDANGTGKDGYSEGDPGLGIPATVVEAEALNDLQESVVLAIEAAQLTPAAGAAQFLDALRRLGGADVAALNWGGETGPSSVALTSLVHSLVRYIGVGEGGKIEVSSDLATWSSKTADGAYILDFAGVAKGRTVLPPADILVAVGTGPEIQRSIDDGDTWASIESTAGAEAYEDVRFGLGQFFVVGTNGVVKTTVDGTAPTTRALPGSPTTDLHAVAMSAETGAGTAIIVGDAGEIYRSTDQGITWVLSSVPAGAPNLRSVAYDGTAWIAGGLAGTLWRSTDDGVTWVEVGSGWDATVSPEAIRHDGLHWVAVGSRVSGSAIMASRDGLVWREADTLLTAAGGVALHGLARGLDRWVAVGPGAGVTNARASLRDWR